MCALYVDILQGGTNSHGVTVDDFNAFNTDFLSDGVVGSIGNSSGVAPMTGAFAVNAQGTPDMTLAVTSGKAYILGTPTSGVSQRVRVLMDANANVTISSNSTGGTRYDWIYIKLDPDKMKDPDVNASDVATLVVSRSTSATTDNGTPPTYGLNIAVVTVANGASSITNTSVKDKRAVVNISNVLSTITSWNSLGQATYGTADGPTQTFTVASDLTNQIDTATRIKYEQLQAISNYWSFDTNNADSKGSATMQDINGGPTYTSGKFANAATFNGTNQGLSITDAAAFQLGKLGVEFTLGCWFKTSAAGTTKAIFQSYSDNTNAQGIHLRVGTGNTLYLGIGSGSADDTLTLLGTTTVTDGNWHQTVITFRNNYVQMYLDGKLEASSYSAAPTYNATNYVRIGVWCVSGASVAGTWFNGQIDDLFLFNGYAIDEQTIKAKYDAATAQGTADITVTKYALVSTKPTYSAPNTTITIYSGTDYTMANAAISNMYYSTQKAPYGFPLKNHKWSVEYQGTGSGQTNPTQNTWYNLGGSLSVPIGSWNISYGCFCYGARAAGGYLINLTSLSIANNTSNDYNMQAENYCNGLTELGGSHFRAKDIALSAKQTFYLNAAAGQTACTNLALSGNAPVVIRATSTLL